MAPFVELDGTAVQYTPDAPKRPGDATRLTLYEALILMAAWVVGSSSSPEGGAST